MTPRHSLRGLVARLGVAVATVGASIIVPASAAAAHAELLDVTPGRCASVSTADAVVLRFSEELDAAASHAELRLDDTEVAAATVDLDDLDRASMVLSVPDVATGSFTVEWTAVSAVDGDRLTDATGFALGSAAVPAVCDANAATGASPLPVLIIGGLSVVVVGALLASRRRVAVVS